VEAFCDFESVSRVVVSVCRYVRAWVRQGWVLSVSVRGMPAETSFDAFYGLTEHLSSMQSERMPHCARGNVHGKHAKRRH